MNNRIIAAEAVRWLIEEKLGWSYEYAFVNLNLDIFKKYNLHYVINEIYNNDIKRAVLDAKVRAQKRGT